jgi:hypothetical protein
MRVLKNFVDIGILFNKGKLHPVDDSIDKINFSNIDIGKVGLLLAPSRKG